VSPVFSVVELFVRSEMDVPVSDAGTLFIERSRYFLSKEYRVKLRAAVEALPAERLWWRSNDQSNSVGNLLLHLAGNVRQWIVCGVGRAPSTRNRDAEFSARSGPPAAELLATLEATLAEADHVLSTLTPANLLEHRAIQGRDIGVLEAVYHVVEHFGQHLGQIVLIAKQHAPGALQFYEDADGAARPLWGSER
jgi:uncharacterized damage-inducible protein DinB